jgi:sugar/nucleoside kinase (ribokinase family)
VHSAEALVVGSLNMDLTAFAPRLPLPGETFIDAQRDLFVIVTFGALGVVHAGPNQPRNYPARETQALDTTAAGDTFIGGLAASLARGDDLTQAIYFGQFAAARSVSRPGAQSSIPTLARVSELRRRLALG